MSDPLDRAVRAFRAHDSFERVADGRYEHVTTAFDAEVAAGAADGRIRFDVTVRAPTLNAVTDDDVAAVVEDGWYDTFELRVADVGGVTATDRDLDPRVRRADDEVVVEMAYRDLDARRGVDDASALVNFVEGTYVQGIIPGYDYRPPVTEILSRAQDAAGF
jgi:hypothetical protein